MKNFLEIFENQTRLGTKIPSPKYLKTGKYPIVDQSKKLICGYSNDSSGLYSDTPFIIFGDVSRTIKYIDFPCYLGADGSVILKVINDQYITKFLYYYLLNQSIPNTGYNRHYKFLKDLKFKEFSLDEQKNAVTIFDTLNALIKKSNEEIVYFDELIKSRFNEMFSNFPATKAFEYCISDNTKYGHKFDSKFYAEDGEIAIVDQGNELICGYIDRQDNKEPWSEECIVFGDHTEYFKYIDFPIYLGADGTKLLSSSSKYDCRFVYYYLLINYRKVGGYARHFKYLKEMLFPEPPFSKQKEFVSFVEKVDKLKFNVQKRIEYYQELLNKKMDEYFN